MNQMRIQAQAHEALERAYRTVPAFDATQHRWNAGAYREMLVQLLKAVGDLSGKKVIDVGAGRGILSLAIRFLGAEVHAVEKYAFDHSESEMFKQGDERLLLPIWEANGIIPHVRDFYEMDSFITPGSFDAAVNLEVIEHVKAPKRFLDATFRTVKPGGFIVTGTPNYGRMQARLRLLFGKNPKLDLEPFYTLGENGFVGHWREYLPRELADMHRWSGFCDVRTRTFCDPFFLLKKRPSPWSVMQTAIHLSSYLLPDARYDLVCVGRKPGPSTV